jgi:uncharacterized protein (DUF983 family)
MPEKTKFKAVLNGKCPRCNEGDMFKFRAYDLRNFDKMYEYCPHCELRFEPEPGFYYGAMYVNYAFSVALFVVLGTLVFYLLDNPDIWVYSTVIFSTVILITPLLFRYSRIIYLHVFGRFKY